jgi:hypothetical protein
MMQLGSNLLPMHEVILDNSMKKRDQQFFTAVDLSFAYFMGFKTHNIPSHDLGVMKLFIRDLYVWIPSLNSIIKMLFSGVWSGFIEIASSKQKG